MKNHLKGSTVLRLLAGLEISDRRPIEIEPGHRRPYAAGETHRYVTRSGKPVYYPNAYRRAWGKPMYVASTRCVRVGQDWLDAMQISPNAKIRVPADWRAKF